MKHLFLVLSFFTLVSAQAQETPLETARTFMRSGDFENAILVLKRAVQSDAKNLELQKELALDYYYKRDYAKALDQIKVAMDNDDADVTTYQVAGNIYKALEEVKEADKMYKKALKKFPKSGALHSEYGELLWAKKDYDAIEYWEKGIQADPSYAGNYYNAAVFHFYTKDKVWSLIYGEIFVNMEYLTERATTIKKLLLDAYKEKLFTDADIMKDQNTKSNFAKAVLQTFGKQASLANKGINTEVLTMIRTRFILDWFNTNRSKYPFKLFEYHQQLIRDGMFDAYNQWLFGTVENLPAYDNWTKTNADQYAKFSKFQKNRVFKLPSGQYYQQL